MHMHALWSGVLLYTRVISCNEALMNKTDFEDINLGAKIDET